jgi:glycosyltransferase involved in cell wall biosynthesis
MVKYKKLLSIIIPTKNRYECLIPVVSALLKHIKSEDMELVIQDNSDDNTLILNYLETINDNRISYFFTKGSISIKDNISLGISNAYGEYVTFIGDDDLVSPFIVDIVKAMKERGINSLIFNSGKYWWRDVVFPKPNFYVRAGVFTMSKNIHHDFIKLDTAKELDVMLNHGCTSAFNLPKFYHGIITHVLLDKIKDRTSISPDISFSTALGLHCSEHYFINYPVTVYGASKNSGGGMTIEKKHFGKIEEQHWLPKNAIEIWDFLIPSIWSEHTTYPVSVSHVLNQYNSKKFINYNVFYSSMLVYEFFLLDYLKPKIFIYNKKNIYGYLYLLFQIFIRIFMLLVNRIKVKLRLLDLIVYEDFLINDCMVELKKIPFKCRN